MVSVSYVYIYYMLVFRVMSIVSVELAGRVYTVYAGLCPLG